jgi:hypothetical protein
MSDEYGYVANVFKDRKLSFPNFVRYANAFILWKGGFTNTNLGAKITFNQGADQEEK